MMTYILRMLSILFLGAAVSACAPGGGWSGLKNAGQADLQIKDTGLSASASPLDGSFGVTLGQKQIVAGYNSNTYEAADGTVVELYSTYGGVTRDARSKATWQGATVNAGQDGAGIGGGSGTAHGPAALIRMCQDGAVSTDGQGNTGQFCMEMFHDNRKLE